MKTIHILQVPVSITSYEEIIDIISKTIRNNKKFSVVSINLNKVIKANESNEVMKIIKSFVRTSKEINDRSTGIDLFNRICDEHKKIGAKIFLYGAKQEIVETAKNNLIRKYNDIQIVGIENGYNKDNNYLVNKINQSGANIVFIAMGSPKQERWIYENKNKINANIFMGVGGTFDIISGKLKRAPMWIQKLGIEWLYRTMREPKRLKNVPLQIKYYLKLKKERRNIK